MFDIRPAAESDAARLAEFAEHTFVETFAKDNTPEDMAEYVASTFGYDKQLAEIRDPKRKIALAWNGTQLAGFYHLYDGPPDAAVKGPKPIELLRLYVSAKWHGEGVAQRLLEECIAAARAGGFQTLWLGVWERNFRAQAFYRKYDFAECGTHVFMVGKDAQTDLVMTRFL